MLSRNHNSTKISVRYYQQRAFASRFRRLTRHPCPSTDEVKYEDESARWFSGFLIDSHDDNEFITILYFFRKHDRELQRAKALVKILIGPLKFAT